MTSFLNHIGRKLAWGIAAVALGIGTLPSRAQVLTYSSSQRQIRVGVVIPQSYERNGPTELRKGFTAPHLFYALDSRTDLKPPGWQFVNPIAANNVDERMTTRWNAAGQSKKSGLPVDNTNPYYLDQPLKKNMAVYWEVPLQSTTTTQLAAFDLLYLAPTQHPPVLGSVLTPTERDKLRKAVDSGAILWVERPGREVVPPGDIGGNWNYGLFVKNDFSAPIPSVGTIRATQVLHPLLTSPYPMSQSELNGTFSNGFQRSLIIPTLGTLDVPSLNSLLKFSLGQDVLMAGPYGSGYVVLSGGNVGEQINDSIRRGDSTDPFVANNRGPYSGDDFSGIPISALKFAYNVLSVKQEVLQERYVPRRTSSTGEQVSAPLSRKWTFPDKPAIDTTNAGSFSNRDMENSASAVVFKGLVIVPASNGHLLCFDMDPARDLDGDGNPDDGVQDNGRNPAPNQRPFDFGTGASYDLIWDKEIGRRMSTPVAATVNTAPNPTDVVFVIDESGQLLSFLALPIRAGNNRISSDPVTYRSAINVSPGGYPLIDAKMDPRIPAPVYGEGRLFAAGNLPGGEGIVSEYDPLTLQLRWRYQGSDKPGNAQAPKMGPVVATPTLAWVDDEGTGAKDLVLYLATAAFIQQNQTGRIFSFLLTVRGERLVPVTNVEYRSRYWLAPNAFKWGNRYVNIDGQPQLVQPPTPQPGRVLLPIAPLNEATVTADYDLDPTDVNYKPRSTFYAFPGQGGAFPHFISSPVLGPDDTLYAVAVDFNRGSSLYAFRDQSPVAYVLWRYSLPGNTLVLGAPAYHNGAVYVGTSQGRLVGFDANPTFYIDLAQPINEAQKFQINIAQIDPTLPSGSQQVSFAYNQSMMEASNLTSRLIGVTSQLPGAPAGSINVDQYHGRIVLKRFSLSGSVALDAARDVQVKYPTSNAIANADETARIQATTSVCFDSQQAAAGSNPLFAGATGNQGNKIFDLQVVPGGTTIGKGMVSGPTIAGSSLFVGGEDGNVYFMPADPCAFTGGGGFSGATVRTLPATDPFTSNPGFGANKAQDAVRGSIVVTGSTLIANTNRGVMVFQQPITMVADSNRLLEIRNSYDTGKPTDPVTRFEASGSEAVWSLSNTTRYSVLPDPGLGVVPNFTVPLPQPERLTLSHPGAVQRLTNTNFLVADSGNNRVVEVDRSGTVLWEMTGFADPDNVLGGSQPLTLNEPTDVQRWTAFNRLGDTEVHTLVVDSGNHRILEIRDTYPRTRQGRPDYHVLVWASQTTNGDHFYEYRKAQRVDGQQLGLPAGEYTVATVSNWQVNSAGGTGQEDSPGSSLVILDGPARDAQGQIIRQNGRYQYAGGRVRAFANKLTFNAPGPDNTRFLNHPTSFERYYTGDGTAGWTGLLTDGEGFYQILGKLDPATSEIQLLVTAGVVGRASAMPTGALGMAAPDNRASGVVQAKRLPNGNTLVVNQSTNQIFEIEAATQKFMLLTQKILGTHALVQPTSADR